MSGNPIQLVLFDLGHVLVRICHTWAEAAQRAGVPELIDTSQPHVKATIERAVDRYERGRATPAEFAEHIAALHDALEPQHVTAITDHWLIGCFEGVDGLIDRVHTASMASGCLSNTSDSHWRMMFSSGNGFAPLDKLRHRFASQLIGARKPEPGVYEHVESATGLSGGAILFFDDLPANVEAAQRRGWRAELVERHVDPVPQMHEAFARHGIG